MPRAETEVLVIGGGPGGSTTATLLARAGRQVRLLEKERFPRFHVGESLLPYNRPLLEELGVWAALQTAGFPRKTGAQFLLANGTKSRRFSFRDGRFTRETEIVQVERSRFDEILLDNARTNGVEVWERWTVRGVAVAEGRATVTATDPGGEQHEVAARYVVDASGRGCLTGNLEGTRRVHPRHRRLAVFGHFEGVLRDPGEAGGDTVIVRDTNSWVWLIPVSDTRTSVGLVLDQGDFTAGGGEAATVFWDWVQRSPALRARLERASLHGKLRVANDFSYFNRRLVGPRLLRVGDAAGFLDPIFSGGVFLAMWSGRLAAQAIERAAAAGSEGGKAFALYARRFGRAMRVYWRLVRYYYQGSFMDLFLEPRRGLDLPAALLAVLAGDLEPAWPLRWRLELFYLLVRLQRYWPLVPRIDFKVD